MDEPACPEIEAGIARFLLARAKPQLEPPQARIENRGSAEVEIAESQPTEPIDGPPHDKGVRPQLLAGFVRSAKLIDGMASGMEENRRGDGLEPGQGDGHNPLLTGKQEALDILEEPERLRRESMTAASAAMQAVVNVNRGRVVAKFDSNACRLSFANASPDGGRKLLKNPVSTGLKIENMRVERDGGRGTRPEGRLAPAFEVAPLAAPATLDDGTVKF